MKRFLQAGTLALLVIVPLPSCGGGDDPKAAACTPVYVYDNVTDEGEALQVLDFESAFNGSGGTEDFTLISNHSATVAMSRSTTDITKFHAAVRTSGVVITGNARVPVVSFQAEAVYDRVHEIDQTVSRSVTTTSGSTVKMTLAPMTRGYGLYGVAVHITTGHLYSTNCAQKDDQGMVSTAVPSHYDWCTWARGPNVFADGGEGPCLVVGYDL